MVDNKEKKHEYYMKNRNEIRAKQKEYKKQWFLNLSKRKAWLNSLSKGL